MNILCAFTHHRRSGPNAYAKALRQLGHNVVAVGPWREQEPFGTKGREPDIRLPDRQPWHYQWIEIQEQLGDFTPDQFWLIEGGEDLRVYDAPVPFAHISTEGTNLDWSRPRYKAAEILCNGADPRTVKWLPKAADPSPLLSWPREYDLVQLASAREARVHLWQTVQQQAPDLHTFFGDIWGPVYDCAYRNALCTYVCSSIDFVTTRVFEGMAAGCVVIADRTPSIQALFKDGVHFIGYDPVPGPGGEGMPDPAWLIDTVRYLKAHPEVAAEMGRRAWHEVNERHLYVHRVQAVLDEMVGGE